ncbi:MAG: LuxR C-terminal-related transcriptional regulator [Chloroflexi bacterium]|nr:LuxR C-terminal-related transcriptional regulator [Chloroflexota bacterium]MBU1749111.1 LuxR C-terminal-related transcriptional regulator [Chloroflexota bacterium]
MIEEPSPLSEREMEIVRLVATGASNRQIARDLYISVNTVKVHLRNIFGKLELNSRTEVAMYAVSQGWVTVGDGQEPGEPDEDAPEEVATEEVAPAPAPATASRRRPLFVAAAAAVGLLLVGLLGGTVVSGVIPLLVAGPTPLPSPLANGATVTALASRWRARAPLSEPRTGLALAVVGGQFYAVGGETADGVVGAVTRYDPQSDTWADQAAKPTPVVDVEAAVLGGRIYVPGGRLGTGAVTDRVEVYDPERDRWAAVAPLPAPRSAYALVAFEGRLYLFGGWDGLRFVADTYGYDPARDAWEELTPMPTARGYAGAAVADGKVFVVGGYDGEHDLAINQEYAPSKDNGAGSVSWTTRAPLPQGRGGAGVVAVADQIHVIGGGWDAGLVRSVKYNVHQDRWEEFEPFTTGIWRNMGVGASDTRIYGVGGWDGRSPVATNSEYQALYVIIIPVAITPVPNP